MYVGKLVFAQVMEHLPLHTFRKIVTRYAGERKVKSFSCLDQFLSMAFAQLTFRESLRDIEACLRAQRTKLYHLGIRSTVARNTLANANAVRDGRIYADFAQSLIAKKGLKFPIPNIFSSFYNYGSRVGNIFSSIYNSKRTNDGNDDGLRRDRLLRFGARCGGACGVDRARTQGFIERG